jgi:hypothetical protein
MPQSNKEQNLNGNRSPSPENIGKSADDLLLDDILREFGNAGKFENPSAESIDDEVSKILQSVRDSLGIDTAVRPDDPAPDAPLPAAVKDDMSARSDTGGSPATETVPESGEVRPDPERPRQTVKVVSEDDPSPIFGDNFAKYFGPDAGLATQIEIPVSEDAEEEDAPPVKKGLFGLFSRRKNRQDDNVYDDEEPEEAEAEEKGETDPEAGGRPEEAEDIEPEEAIQSLIRQMGLIRLRLLFGSIMCALLLYITVAPKLRLFVPDILSYVRNPNIYLFTTSALLILVMIMCVETVAVGIRDLLRFRPNMESIVALSALLSLAHSISIIVFPLWEGYYPYSSVSALSVLFAAYYRQKLKMARFRAYKTVGSMTKPYLVVREKGVYGGLDGIVKYRAAKPMYFVNQCERNDAARKAWFYVAPLVIVLSVASAAISSFGNGQPQRFLWNLSAMIAVAAPFSACLPFNLPFAKLTKHLGMVGEAIAGWSAAEDLSTTDNLIVTDSDLFPPGSITLNGLKIFGGYAVDKVISYSASLIAASGAATSKPFLDLIHDQATTLRKVSGFRYYENGGVGGEINGESVIAGSASFMLRTGIRIPKDINIKHAIYIAINQELAGIFAVNYNAQGAIKKALNLLRKNRITPVLAIRDFNITPSMIESKFNISTDTADFPPIEGRLSLSNPDRVYIAKPAAVIGREGLSHYTECVVCARNLRKATKICLVLTFISILIAMLLMFFFMYTHAPVQATPANLIGYMAFWLLPNVIATGWVKK